MSMRFTKTLAAFAVAALAAGALGDAEAHGRRGHARVGVWVGGPLVGPGWWAPGPYYYGPPAVYGYPYGPVYYEPAVVASPPVYVERPAPDAAAYWYWCADPQGYYPSVPDCPGGWQRVAPQAPASR